MEAGALLDRTLSPSQPISIEAERALEVDEQLLSDAEKERLRLARTVFGLFSKTVKAIRLYVGKGPHVERFRADLFRELQQYLMNHGDLRVDVAPDALLLSGYAVLSSTAEEGDDLLYGLFREGVREIAFLPGLPATELAAFLDLLVQDITGDERRPDDDRATLFWIASFEHVAIRLADVLTSGALFVSNPAYRQQFAQRVQQLVQRAASALAPQGRDAHATGRGSGEAPTEAEADAQLGAFAGFALAEALATPDEHREALGVKELFDADGASQPVRFLEVLCEAMAATRAPADRARAAEHATRLLEDLMAEVDLDRLAAAVSTLRAHASVRDATREVRAAFVAEALAPLARYHRLILLRPVLMEGKREDLDKLLPFFEILPRSELEGLVSFLVKLGDGPAARPLRELLEQRGADMTPFHVGRLKSENVLVVLDSLRALASNSSPKAVEAVRGLLDNRNPSVRRQALLTLKGRWNDEVCGEALRFLNGDEVGMRLAALEVIAASHDPGMVEPLLALADRPDFARRDTDERRQHLSALLACDRRAVLPWIKAQIGRRSLFGRRQAQALQEGAVLALLDHDAPETRQVLIDWLAGESASSPLRQQVEPVLNLRLAEEEAARQETP